MSYDQIMTGMFVFNILFFLLLAVLGSVAAERSSKPDTWHDRFLFAAMLWTVISIVIACVLKVKMTGNLL